MRYLTETELAPLDGATATITPIGGTNPLVVALRKVHVGTFRAAPYEADVYALRATPDGELHASWRNPAGGYTPVVLTIAGELPVKLVETSQRVKTPLTNDLSVLNDHLPRRHALCAPCNRWWVQSLGFQTGTEQVDGDLNTCCPVCDKPPTAYSAWFDMRDGD